MAVVSAAAGLLLLAIGWAVTSSASAQSIPADAQTTCTVSAADFAGWFETGTPSLNGVVKPADSVLFPNSPNCSFYQWSEQMFLWLTSPAPVLYGGGRRIFDSPAFFDVSLRDASGERTFIPHVPGVLTRLNLRVAQPGPHGLPVIFDRAGRMLEVERRKFAPSGKQIILNRLGRPIEIERAILRNGRPVFLDKAGKTIAGARAFLRPQLSRVRTVQKFVIGQKTIFLNSSGNVVEVGQGQADNGVLQAQNGSLVYYDTMVNDVYAYFLTGAKNGGITPQPTQFPTTLAELNKIIAFAAAHGKTFPDPNALAVEVKTSWVEAAGLLNPSSYITMRATIPTYDMSNPNQWTPNGKKTVLLALVGMHVVGSAAGHPEMIWATFEHFGNTPNADYTYNSTTGPKTVSQSTMGTWLFCASNSTGPFNEEHMHTNGPNIVSLSPHTISPSDTIRWKAWGGSANVAPNPLANSAASNTEIIAINNSVRGMLPSNDVRNNYFMTGATWTIGGATPTGSFNGGNEVGTSKMSNTTMETYQQGSDTLWATGSNCFSCHFGNDTGVSHVYDDLKALF
jgi:hypothetical protein